MENKESILKGGKYIYQFKCRILVISIFITILINLLLLIDPPINLNLQLITHLILTVWGFSFVPSFIYFLNYLNNKIFQEGLLIDNFLKFSLFLVPILLAQYFMIKYYMRKISV